MTTPTPTAPAVTLRRRLAVPPFVADPEVRLACVDPTVHPDVFFGDHHDEAEAKRICRRCPARLTCAEWALRAEIPHGVYGGTTAEERAAERRRRAKTGKPPAERGRPVVLDDVKVADIRRRAATGIAHAALAADHGVSVTTVSKIVNGHTWTRAGGPLTHSPRGRRRAPTSGATT